MKLQTKKIIAREFLVLIVTVIIASISFVLIYPYNSYRQNQLDKLTDTIYSKSKLADSLANSYNIWSIQQQKDPLKDLYNEFNSQLNLAKNYDEFKQVMSDQKNRQVFFNEFNPKINLAKSFNEFDEALGFKKDNQSQDDPFAKYGGKIISTDAIGKKNTDSSTPKPVTDYIDNVYKALKLKVGGFDVTPDDFRKAITTDNNYRNNVYKALKAEIDGFSKTPSEFSDAIELKKSETSTAEKPRTSLDGISLSSSNKKGNDVIPYYSEIKKQADKIYKEIDTLNKDKEFIQSKIFSAKEQTHFATIIFIIFLSLLFIVRYIFYSIKWSIKTLQQNIQ